jgi:long-chain acyl-CoA synthetase
VNYNFATALVDAARLSPHKIFAVAPDGSRHSFRDTLNAAGRASAVLRARGIGEGDRVGLRLTNSMEFISYYFAILGLGATVFPLNPAGTAREVDYVASDADLNAIIIGTSDPLRGAPSPLFWAIDDLVAEQPAEVVPFAPIGLSGVSTAIVLYTSGSTGEPKGVEFSHLGLMMVPVTEGFTTPVGEDEVIYAVLPFFHVYGIADLINGPVLRRNTIILREKFRTADALEVIERERVTIFCGVPTMFHALVEASKGDRDLSSVHTAASGGAPMSPSQISRITATFPNAHFVEGYGLTETGAAGTYNGQPFEFRHGSVGRAMVGMEVAIIDPDGSSMPAGPDNVGEIRVRGPVVMKGYFRRPELTAESLLDGWLRTGDLGWLDEDGYLYIVGRSKDLIIRGGFNVYPKEVEDILLAHPTIAQAAVVGRPHEHYGEEIVAFVVRTDEHAPLSTDEIIEYCAAQLAPYKYPREIVVLAELPLGPTGKINKQALARDARALHAEA